MKCGDPLPTKVLPDNAWKLLQKMLECEPKPINPDFFTNVFYPYCVLLAQRYCVGENENKCLICGCEQHLPHGICKKCQKYTRRFCRLRAVGRVRKLGLSRLEITPAERSCIVCGKDVMKAPTYAGNLCRSHYELRKRLKLKSDEDLLEHLKQDVGIAIEPPLFPITYNVPPLKPSNILEYSPSTIKKVKPKD